MTCSGRATTKGHRKCRGKRHTENLARLAAATKGQFKIVCRRPRAVSRQRSAQELRRQHWERRRPAGRAWEFPKLLFPYAAAAGTAALPVPISRNLAEKTGKLAIVITEKNFFRGLRAHFRGKKAFAFCQRVNRE